MPRRRDSVDVMVEPHDLAGLLGAALTAAGVDPADFEVGAAADGGLCVMRRRWGSLEGGARELEATSEATFPPPPAEAMDDERVAAWVDAWVDGREQFTSMDEAPPALLRRPELVTRADFARAFTDWEFCALVANAEDSDPDVPPPDALQAAIEVHDFVRVGDLLDAHPELATTRDDAGFTPLHVAAERCSVVTLPTAAVRVIERLLAAGADPEAATDDGLRPLHLARAAAVRPLVRAGADLEARNAMGQTPLIVQAQEGDGCPALIELLAVGAARDARDADGLTASDYARARGEADKLEALA